MTLPDLPELEFSDHTFTYKGDKRIDYNSIEAITFKMVPLGESTLASLPGFDTYIPLSSDISRLAPKLALHLPGDKTLWLWRGWNYLDIPLSRVAAIDAAAEFLFERPSSDGSRNMSSSLSRKVTFATADIDFAGMGTSSNRVGGSSTRMTAIFPSHSESFTPISNAKRRASRNCWLCLDSWASPSISAPIVIVFCLCTGGHMERSGHTSTIGMMFVSPKPKPYAEIKGERRCALAREEWERRCAQRARQRFVAARVRSCAGFPTPALTVPTTRSGSPRPKSAKARNRGVLGTDGAAASCPHRVAYR